MNCPNCDVEMDYVKYYDEWMNNWSDEFISDKNGMINVLFCPECGCLKVVKKSKENNV